MPHSRSLLRVARRVSRDGSIAEDIVQETLLLAWRGFDQFERGTNARAWLFRILFNVFYGRGRKLRAGPILVTLDDKSVESEKSSRTIFSSAEAAEVSQAFGQLSEDHRTILLLGVIEGFTCREMAEILSLPIGTVMSRISRARQALRERLESVPLRPEIAHPRAQCAEREAS